MPFKSETNEKISIVTVCFNAKLSITRTIESVLEQTYRPLEYIIIDGQSTDGTMEVVTRYENIFNIRGIDFTYVSEKDEGIYDAMNKGVKYAKGSWINFMNADDCFHDKNALKKIFSNVKEGVAVIFGDECIVNADGHMEHNKRSEDISNIKKYLPFCHQSSFTRIEYCDKYPFDTTYQYIADMDFFLKLYYWERIEFQYVPVIVCDYYKMGASYLNALDAFSEWTKLRKRYNYPGNVECIEKAKDIVRYYRLRYRLRKDQR